jgi:hypothetical protein
MYKEFVLRGTPLRYAPPSGHPFGAVRLTSATRYHFGGSRPVYMVNHDPCGTELTLCNTSI